MATVTLKGNAIKTAGELPGVHTKAPEFSLVKNDLSSASLGDFKGKKVVLNIFPSVDTGTCAASVRKFNQEASKLDNTVVLCISRDLPFAQARFCGAEGLDNVVTLSDFRERKFGKDYGVEFTDGPLTGLLSRAVVVVDTDGKVIHTEQVSETVDEPDYDAALKVLK
ncbi:thiol peroxidase, atypical 2-Cys peroxiredoxin [Sinomicrobium oceani]|uniref:Thiol peroxidase n=1 Tax=Sinomicrobium oceani TaxID=1150368 RepID=A0A1K1Q8U2_9FLAO|nr:thiol peroxidase [Sinomicrobium oceani]SFW56370.1 thiol peroxidase, atypical 2-Cys peroxiredoxin [Sinomicrobium oceani]